VPGALVVVEEDVEAKFTAPDGYEELERRDYGESELVFLRRN
jgi:16S rRNA (guanine966-N2)-methyltransferase